MRNLILVGKAEEIDLLPPEIRAMVDNEGIYLCGDTARPEYTVPVASIGGRLYSMKLDEELDPERFHKTVTVAGPYHKSEVPPNAALSGCGPGNDQNEPAASPQST
jgi:hypothetical protein